MGPDSDSEASKIQSSSRANQYKSYDQEVFKFVLNNQLENSEQHISNIEINQSSEEVDYNED